MTWIAFQLYWFLLTPRYRTEPGATSLCVWPVQTHRDQALHLVLPRLLSATGHLSTGVFPVEYHGRRDMGLMHGRCITSFSSAPGCSCIFSPPPITSSLSMMGMVRVAPGLVMGAAMGPGNYEGLQGPVWPKETQQ